MGYVLLKILSWKGLEGNIRIKEKKKTRKSGDCQGFERKRSRLGNKNVEKRVKRGETNRLVSHFDSCVRYLGGADMRWRRLGRLYTRRSTPRGKTANKRNTGCAAVLCRWRTLEEEGERGKIFDERGFVKMYVRGRGRGRRAAERERSERGERGEEGTKDEQRKRWSWERSDRIIVAGQENRETLGERGLETDVTSYWTVAPGTNTPPAESPRTLRVLDGFQFTEFQDVFGRLTGLVCRFL